MPARFRSRSVAVVVLLTLVTASYYFVYWLYRQTAVLNARLPTRRISGGFVALVALVAAASLAAYSLTIFWEDPYLDLAERLAGSLHFGLLVIWAFRVRNRLNYLLQARRGDSGWSGALATWWLQAIYLQWKINRNLEQLNEERIAPRIWRPKRYRYGFWRWTAVAIVPLLPVVFIVAVVVASWTSMAIGRVVYHRAKASVERELGPLDGERFVTAAGCEDPLRLGESAQALDLDDEEAERMRVLAAVADLVEPPDLGTQVADVLRRNREVLAGFRRDLGDESRCLDVEAGEPGTDANSRFAAQARFLHLEFLRALRALRAGDPGPALAAVVLAGRSARALERGPGVLHHLLGLDAERTQLRLVSLLVASRRVGAERLATLGVELSDVDLHEALRRGMAYQSLHVHRNLLPYGMRQVASARETEDSPYVTMAAPFSRAVVYFMTAGGHEWNLRYATAFGSSYAEQKESLDYDPKALSRLQRVRLATSLRDWSLPGGYQIVADAREMAAYYLAELGRGARQVDGCDGLRPAPPALAGRLSTVPLAGGGCALEYTLRRQYEELIAAEQPSVVQPPLQWTLEPPV